MKSRKGQICAIVFAAMFSCVPAVQTQAAEKINSVSIRMEIDGYDDEGVPIMNAESGSSHYSVSDIESAYYNSDYDDEGLAPDTTTFIATLEAEEGYYFNITKKDSIKLKGNGAKFVKASRRNNGTTLIVTMDLTEVEAFVEEIEEAWWDAPGYAKWNASKGASTYLLWFCGENTRSKKMETGGLTYDFRPLMQETGSYEFKVRAVSSTGEKTEWMEGGSFYVTDEMAADNRAVYEVKKEITFKDGAVGPSNQIVRYLNTGWQLESDGRYWYRNEDGTYPQTAWMQLGEDWYFFGADGYKKQNEYAQWKGHDYYFDATGRMVANAKTPDGRRADETGMIAGKSMFDIGEESASGPGVQK